LEIRHQLVAAKPGTQLHGVARFDRAGMLRLVAGAARRRHVLTLVATDPGLKAYVFTFGP